MGIIPRLIMMFRNRKIADYMMQQHQQQLAEQQAREKKREQAQMMALLNPDSFSNSMQFDLGSLLRD